MGVNIIFERDAVHELLGRAAGVAGSTATAPIVGHALLEHRAHGVRITVTDLDAWLTLSVPAEAKKFAPIALPAGDLHRLIAALPAGAQAELSWDKEDATFVHMKSGRARFKLPVMAAADFPETPRGADSNARFSVAAGNLATMFSRTKWAIGKEENRFYLMGIFLHRVDERLVCAATTGAILGRADSPATDGTEDLVEIGLNRGGAIVPTAAIKTISSLINDTDDTLEVTVSALHMRVEREDDDLSWSYTTRLIDGTFPDYEKVIPDRDGLLEVDVQSEAIQGALARVALLSSDSHAIKITGTKTTLTISAAGADGREADEEIDASWRDKKPLQGVIGFNAKYLKAILDHLSAETVVLALSPDGKGASLVTARGRDDALAVIMPVAV